MKRLIVAEWLNTITATPDARGEIVTALRGEERLPSQLPHCSYFYCLVRDKLKLTSREHKSAAVALFAEYQTFRKGLTGDDA